ncbi:MAG: hypothetical protein M1398_03445 [Deltaproteobacteria bacterium]|nr:hypothetical protein [Deltaproteobacteria bacterium]
MDKKRKMHLRKYTAGEITRWKMRKSGFENYLHVLGGPGELELRPPVLPLDGLNRAARKRGRAAIREALREQK